MRKGVIYFTFLVLSACNSLEKVQPPAKISGTLTLDDTIRIARKRNLDLKVSKLKKNIARIDKNISFGNFLPSVDMYGGYSKLSDEVNLEKKIPYLGNLELELLDREYSSFSLNGTIPIFVPALWYIYDSRKKGEEIQKLIYDLSDKALKIEVMNSFYKISDLKEKERYLKKEEAKGKIFLKKARVSLEVEAIMPWEYEKAVVYSKEIELRREKNMKELEIEKMNLLTIMNCKPFSAIDIVDQKNVVIESLKPLNYYVTKGLEKNEKLKILRIKNKIDENKVKIAITNFLPKIVVSGGFVSNSNKILADPDFLNLNVVGVISVFNGFKNINEYKKAKIEKNIGELELEKEFLKTSLEIANSYKRLEVMKKYVELAELNYKSEEKREREIYLKYEIGECDELEALDASTRAQKSYFKVIEARHNYELLKGILLINIGESPMKRLGDI